MKRSISAPFRLDIPALIVGIVCYLAIDFVSLTGTSRSGPWAWPLFLVNGAFAGIAVAAVARRHVAAHLAIVLALFQVFTLFGLPLAMLSWTSFQSFLISVSPTFLWFVGAWAAGGWLSRRTIPICKLRIAGVGDAFEPQPRPRLALFFGLCAVMPAVAAIMTHMKLGVAAMEVPSEAPAEDADPMAWAASFIAVFMIVAGWMGAITFVGGFLGLMRRCYPASSACLLASGGHCFLWLRPFDIDGLPLTITGLRHLIFAPVGEMLGLSLEQRICRAFRGTSDLIAIGKPSEKLPAAGAARLYTADDQWQSVINGLLGHCDGVLLHIAASDGTLWEWQTAFAQVPRTRIVMCVPVPRRKRQAAYQKAKAIIETRSGARLPAKWQRAAFLYFESDTSLQAQWLTRRAKIPANHPLRLMLLRLKRIKTPAMKTYWWVWALFIGIIALPFLGPLLFMWYASLKEANAASRPLPPPSLVTPPR